MAPELHFFIGKGGVGKSTTSALCALEIARQGRDTLLVSMDPAHNQQDIFECVFSEKSRPVNKRLAVKEVDTDYWIAKYLKETQAQIKKTYSYEGAFNLQSYFNVLRFSPGLEEYALILAFENILRAESHRDVIIFDMPPTAQALRFFSLPSITLVWLEELLKLRKAIYAKKEIISKIKVGAKTLERDKVKSRLQRLIETNQHLHDHFRSRETHINLVLNNEKLSASESVRLKKKLADIQIGIRHIIVNKDRAAVSKTPIRTAFKSESIVCFPESEAPLFGLEALKAYLGDNPGIALAATARSRRAEKSTATHAVVVSTAISPS